jgi:hypothetical protein
MSAGFEDVTSIRGRGIPGLSRRRFLASLTALGAGAMLSGCHTTGSTESGKPHRIDVHHHIAPPGYSNEFKATLKPSRRRAVDSISHPTEPACDDCGTAGSPTRRSTSRASACISFTWTRRRH